eukprot:g12149.t1
MLEDHIFVLTARAVVVQESTRFLCIVTNGSISDTRSKEKSLTCRRVVPLSLPGLIVDDQSCQEGPMVEPQSSWHAVSPARAWPSPPNRLTHEEHVRKLEEYLRDLQDMPELLSATIELKQEVSNIMAQLRERSL